MVEGKKSEKQINTNQKNTDYLPNISHNYHKYLEALVFFMFFQPFLSE